MTCANIDTFYHTDGFKYTLFASTMNITNSVDLIRPRAIMSSKFTLAIRFFPNSTAHFGVILEKFSMTVAIANYTDTKHHLPQFVIL